MPELEYVTVADHAEAINGKLYLQGAGWTDIQQPMGPAGQPGIVHMGIAVSILVGWNETNRRFPLMITVVHEDGAELTKVSAQIESGRPPGTVSGTEFRSVLAIGAEMQFPNPGRYEVRAELEDAQKIVVFRVHRPAQAGGPSPLPPGAAT